MDLRDWLRSLGLERYEVAFRENEIDETVLPSLTAEDLKDLASISSDIAANSSMPSPLCVLTPLRKTPPATQCPHPRARHPKTGPSAAKSP